jgi:hypothetical protein
LYNAHVYVLLPPPHLLARRSRVGYVPESARAMKSPGVSCEGAVVE